MIWENMKKIILVVLCFASCLTAGAQGFHFGAQTSLNISNITNMGSEIVQNTEPKAKTGLAIGGYAEYSFGRVFSLQADLMYSRQGVSLGSAYLDPTDPASYLTEEPGKVKIKTHYINVPLKAKFTYEDKVFAYLGPQIGFCLGGKRKKDNSSVNINSELNTIDCGLIMGAGWQFDFGLNLGLSYYLGFDNVFKEVGNTSKNRVFAITAGWRIQ